MILVYTKSLLKKQNKLLLLTVILISIYNKTFIITYSGTSGGSMLYLEENGTKRSINIIFDTKVYLAQCL